MRETPVTDRLLLPPREAAAALSISERTLWAVTAPRGPLPAVRIGRSVRYCVDDIRRWIDGQKETGRCSATSGDVAESGLRRAPAISPPTAFVPSRCGR